MPASSLSPTKSSPSGGNSARAKPRGSATTKVRPDEVRRLLVVTYKYFPSEDQCVVQGPLQITRLLPPFVETAKDPRMVPGGSFPPPNTPETATHSPSGETSALSVAGVSRRRSRPLPSA